MSIHRRDFLLGTAALTLAACASSSATPQLAAPAPTGAKIVVIGAGLSGLATAYELVKRGFDVTVLEAQDRAGGRILTIRSPFTDDLHVEAGAMHVVGDPDLLALMRDVGVELDGEFKRPKLANVAFKNGARKVWQPGESPPEDSGLTPEEQKLGMRGRVGKYFPEALTTDPRAWTAPPSELARYDAVSAAQHLRSMGASPAFIQDMSESFGLGGGAESMSALSLLRDLASFFRERELTGGGRVKGGTDNFPRAIAAKLGARVLFGAKVRRVEQDATEARVTFFRRGELSRLRASRVVFALPFSLLRNIDIAPGLSEQKRLAVRDLKLESVTRIYAQAKRRFWIERGERGRADTDLPIGVVTDETERQVGQGGVLGAYLKDAIARRYAAMSAAERVAAVTGSIDRVHPGMKEQFVAGASKCWDDDPFALGAYAWFKPGQLVGFGALGEREGRLHFAGDHTSHRPGFMHGALASAKRVIGEIAGENSIGQSAPARH